MVEQLYDLTLTVAKVDTETNINASTGSCIVPLPHIPIPPAAQPAIRFATDGTYFFLSTKVVAGTGIIRKINSLGNVVGTFNPGFSLSNNNPYSLWYDGAYLFAGYTTGSSGSGFKVFKIDPTTMNLVAFVTNPDNHGIAQVFLTAQGSDVYFNTGFGETYEYNYGLSILEHTYVASAGVSAVDIGFDGTNLWNCDSRLGGHITVTNTSLGYVASGNWPIGVTGGVGIEQINGAMYGADQYGNLYKMALDGVGGITFTFILTVPNAKQIMKHFLRWLDGNVYIVTNTTPLTIYAYSYPGWVLQATKTVPDSETIDVNQPFGNCVLLMYGQHLMVLTSQNIYDVSGL